MKENNSTTDRKESYIAIYLRISKEDYGFEEGNSNGRDDSNRKESEKESQKEGEKESKKEDKKETKRKREESNSIKNQRELLLQFIKSQKEFANWCVLEFSDDGYSGTNLNRPAMNKLLEQAKQGKINCILVKDFSRFSRDYIVLGSYLEQIFPFLGVRFLSLNDAYDSEKEQGIKMNLESTFQSLLSDWYSKDLSIKVKASLKAGKEKGQYISPYPPYGYRKDQTKPCQIVICKEEAEVVQMIFSLALEGKTLCEIARFFNQKGLPTRTNAALWRAGTIRQILKNQFYTGDMIYNKYEKERVGERSNLKAKEVWKCISNHHAAIIEREQFERVQNLKNLNKKKKENIISNQTVHLFRGKLFCGACQKTLQIKNTKHPYFTCTTRYIADKNDCVKRLEIGVIGQMVEQIIWKNILFYQMEEDLFFIKHQYFQQKEEKLQEKIQHIKKEQEKISIKKIIEYKKYALGDIEKEAYFKWKNQITNRQKELIQLQEKYHTKIIFLKKIEQEEKIVTLCQEFVEIFIKQIFIFDRKQLKKKLKINWNFCLPDKDSK